MRKQLLKKVIGTSLTGLMLMMPMTTSVAKIDLSTIAKSGANAYLAREEIVELERNGRDYSLQQIAKEFGYSNDYEANAMLDRISARILAGVEAGGEKIKTPFTFNVNASNAFNAARLPSNVVTVNKGLFDTLNYDEHEIAFVIAHEVGHAQGEHLMNKVDKIVGLRIIADLYNQKNQNNTSEALVAIVSNNINAKGWTLPNEKDADRRGFIYAVNGGYNPGAGAAVWCRAKAKFGDYSLNGLGATLKPNDHPTNSQRIASNNQWMKEFSGNRVWVEGTKVMLDEKILMNVHKTNIYFADERAFIIAGNLARIYHNNLVDSAWVSDEGTVYVGDMLVATPRDEDTPSWTIADRLNKVNRE